MPTKRFHLRPIAIIAASILILGGAIYAVLMTIARVGDDHQRAIEQRIVTSALDQQRVKLSGMLVQQAYWDLGYDEVSDHLNVAWADANFGRSGELAGVPLTAIFDYGNLPVYRFSAPATAADAAAIGTSPSLAVLVDRALAAPTLPPRPVTAFVRVRTTLYFAAAERIVPNDARAAHPLARHYALAYLLPVDAAMMKSFQSGFNVAPLALAPSPAPQLAHVALVDTTGAPLAWLNWRSARPGEDFANGAAPVAISCFILLAALQLVVVRWWMEMAQKVHDEAVGRTAFLANVSHELRTPLNAIIGFSDCMAGEMFGPLSPRYREYARDIKSSGQLLLGIVNDVLDLTHLTSIAEVIMQPVMPAEALVGAVRMLREYAKCDEISINYIDRSGNAEVAANEKALSQILLNLGSNAVKFSAPKSSVDVIVERAGDWLDIVVRDRGQGIAPEKLRLVGQPFFQAHASARKPGSGLGLAIVKKLTERLGGEFGIESTLGAGTTARVRLPVLRSTASSSRTRVAA
jgi:signal transduction histidine kinase